jgi:hypothetical protein
VAAVGIPAAVPLFAGKDGGGLVSVAAIAAQIVEAVFGLPEVITSKNHIPRAGRVLSGYYEFTLGIVRIVHHSSFAFYRPAALSASAHTGRNLIINNSLCRLFDTLLRLRASVS